MRIYKRRGGDVYWYQWRGERKSLRTTDRKAAEIEGARIQRDAADPSRVPPNETPLSVALASFTRRQTERGRAAGTVKQYGVHAGHLVRILGDVPIATIAARELDGYESARHREGASRSTIWKERCTLRGTLRLARRHGLYPHPLDVVFGSDFQHDYTPLTRHLSLPEVDRLIEALPAPRARVVAFVVAFGADWRSVETAVAGDVGEADALIRGTKNAHRWRRIPVLEPFRHLAALARPPFQAWPNVRRDLEVACTRAGVGDPVPSRPGRRKVTPRDLRRSHGMALRAMGVEPQLIGPMLGHADSRMVERVYGRLTPDALAALMHARTAGTGTPKVQKQAKKRSTKAKPGKKSRRRAA